MPVILILTLSVLLQFFAAFFAIRLIKVAKTYSWILIAFAIFLMGVRRLIPLLRFLFSTGGTPPDFTSEIIALFISILILLGLIGIKSVLTKRNVKENEICELEKRLSLTLDNMMEGCQIIGFDWQYIYLNNTAEKHNRRPKQEMLGKRITDIWPGINNTEVYRLIKLCINDRISQYIESIFVFPDGKTGWFDINILPVPEGVLILSIDITERKSAENELITAHKRIRQFIDSNIVGIVIASADGKIIETNDYYLNMIGYTREEFEAGMVDWRSITPPEWLPVDEKAIKELRERGTCTPYEKEYIRRDGKRIQVFLADALLPGAEEQIAAFALDISERKQAEKALVESERYIKTVLDNLPIGVAVNSIKPSINFSYMNDNFPNFYRTTREKLTTPDAFWEAVYEDPDYREKIKKKVLDDCSIGNAEQMYWEDIPVSRKGEGTYFVTAKNILIPGTQLLVSTVWDVTKRKLAEASLEESEERFRSIVEGAPDPIFIQTEGKFSYLNPAALRLFGARESSELIGKPVMERFHPDYHDVIRERIRTLNIERKPVHQLLEFKFIRLDGSEGWVETAGEPIVYKGKNGALVFVRDITERKLAEDALRKSEELFKNLFKYHAAVKILIDPDSGNILDANEAAEKYYGWTYKQITEMKIQNINILPEDEVKAAMEKVKEQKKSHFEFRHRRADGSIRNVEIFSSNIKTHGKDILHSIIHDITERKKAEEKVKELNRMHAVLSEINQTIVRINDQQELFESVCRIAVETGKFRFCWVGIIDYKSKLVVPVAQCGFSGGYLENIKISISSDNKEGRGPTGTAVRGKSFIICNDIENDKIMLPWRDEALKREYRSSAAFSLIRGETVYGVINFYSSKTGFFDEEEINLLKDLSTDISYSIEKIESEKERIKIENERNRLFNYSIDMFAISGFDGYFRQLNPAWERTLGWKTEELLAKPYIEFVHPEDIDSTLKRIKELITVKRPEPYFLNRCLCKDGTYKWMSWNSVPVKEENLIFTVVRDVTPTIRNENERKSLEAQLIQAQKLESLGTMAGGMAHDFNNILNIIMGYSSLLGTMNIEEEEFSGSVEAILNASRRGAGLVKQLLTFARKTETDFQTIQINEIITEIKKLLGETFPKTIEFFLDLQSELPFLLADATQIHQVFLNLCVNARDAMPDGGKLTITTKSVHCDTVKEQNPLADDTNYIKIEVTDTGTGIDETVIQRIFDPFFTTKETGKGTGLGLALVYSIIKNHDGYINVTSEIGKGTTFHIYLQSSEKPAEIQQFSLDNKEVTEKQEGTILLIEDEKLQSELLTTILILKGYKVICAYDGSQGVTSYRDHRDEISLVISDIGLPKLEGDKVYKRIKKINPDAKIILMTGYMDPAIITALHEAGVRHILQKPYTPENVLKTIEKVIKE